MIQNAKLYLSIIIPAYNEEKKITKDIEEAFSFLAKTRKTGEVIISTDGVTDKTNKIVNQLRKRYQNLILLAEKEKIGKGAAIAKGVRIAKGKYIMFADAGYCVPFKYIDDGIRKIKKGYDCALASRAFRKSHIKKTQPFYRKFGSILFGFLIHTFMDIPHEIKDTQCGFKIYTNKAAKKLYKNIHTKRFMFDIEVILKTKRLGLTMVQFPVDWSNDSDTKFNLIYGSFNNVYDLLRIKLLYKL